MSRVFFSGGIQLNVLKSSEAPKGTIGWEAIISWGLQNHKCKKTKNKLHILWESATKRQVDRFYLKAAAFPRKYGRSRGHVTRRSTNRRAPRRSLPVVFPVSVCKLRKKIGSATRYINPQKCLKGRVSRWICTLALLSVLMSAKCACEPAGAGEDGVICAVGADPARPAWLLLCCLRGGWGFSHTRVVP